MTLNRGHVKGIVILAGLMVCGLAVVAHDWIGYIFAVAVIGLLIIGGVAYSAERWG